MTEEQLNTLRRLIVGELSIIIARELAEMEMRILRAFDKKPTPENMTHL